jgi:hypothetical protein
LGCPYDSKSACNYNFHLIYAQATMPNNQNKGERGKEVSSNMIIDDNDTWDDHTIVTWDNEGEYVIYLPSKRKGNIMWILLDYHKIFFTRKSCDL